MYCADCPTEEARRLDPLDSDPTTDPYYSNQGEAGTCVRHAIAKAIIREISGYTDHVIKFNVICLAQLLNFARRDLGAGGAHPEDFHMVDILASSLDGHCYDLKIEVQGVPLNRSGGYHVVCLDLRQFLPSFRNRAEPQLHAMFCLSRNADGSTIFLKNSWGHQNELLSIDTDVAARTPYSKAYYVRIVHFERHDYRHYPRHVFASSGEWKCMCWTARRANGGRMCGGAECNTNQCQRVTNGARCENQCHDAPRIVMCRNHM